MIRAFPLWLIAATTGRITGFDFTALDTVYIEPEPEPTGKDSDLQFLSQRPNFVGDKYVFSSIHNDDPYTMGFADKDFTEISYIKNIRSLDIRDSATGDLFYGPYGLDFSPVITVSSSSMELNVYVLFSSLSLFWYWYTYWLLNLLTCLHLQDPGTGVGKLFCTSVGKTFWEVSLQLNDTNTPNKWEITTATKWADDITDYSAGGFSFVPSGSYKDNIILSDRGEEELKMMEFDANGLPTTNITNFMEDLDGAYGVFFDPQVRIASPHLSGYCYLRLSALFFLTDEISSSCICRQTTCLFLLGMETYVMVVVKEFTKSTDFHQGWMWTLSSPTSRMDCKLPLICFPSLLLAASSRPTSSPLSRIAMIGPWKREWKEPRQAREPRHPRLEERQVKLRFLHLTRVSHTKFKFMSLPSAFSLLQNSYTQWMLPLPTNACLLYLHSCK